MCLKQESSETDDCVIKKIYDCEEIYFQRFQKWLYICSSFSRHPYKNL